MNLPDSATLVASLIWGSIGFGCAAYGMKQKAWLPLLGGIALMTASYFFASALWMWLVCLAIAAAMYGWRGRF